MSQWPANRYLTPAMERVLRRMRDEELELDHVPGQAFWWLDATRIHASTANALLRLVLISGQLSDRPGEIGHFTINEDGLGVLESADYVPRIERELAKRDLRVVGSETQGEGDA